MKGRTPMLVLACALTAFGQAGFVWDYNGVGPYFWDFNDMTYLNGFVVNGDISFATIGEALWASTVSGANPNDYEVDTTLPLRAPGGTYFHFLRVANSNSLTVALTVPSTWQSGGSVPVTITQCTSSGYTQIGSTSIPLHSGDTVRSIVWGTNLWIFVNNVQEGIYTVPLTTGQPGFGGSGIPSNSGFTDPTARWVRIGHHDTVPPLAPAGTTFASSVLPNSASLKWQATADDPIGIGVAGYQISRNGTVLTTISEPEYTDATVQPSTSYSYVVQAVDFHGNIGPATTIDLKTPPAGSIDPRRVGIYSTGSYWGGGGEQIDTRSGNLHFSVPLLTAQGRTGWTVPVNLIYDSQNWRQDNGVNWQLGNDVGYGFGWKLLIGSITPYYTSNWSGVDHYVYTDASGAQYRLDQNNNGIWSSLEAVYIWFDANANNLHFTDGSFWVMGCTSGGAEPDGGTMYPTVIEDRFGNQVVVSYDIGTSVSYFSEYVMPYNTSSRILAIDDVRATAFYGPPYNLPVPRATYLFTYTYPPASGPIPHIASFKNFISTPESGTFTVVNSQPQEPPFGSDPNYSNATTSFLSGLTTASLQPYTFSYDSVGAGELMSVIFPYGGEISWSYGSFQYIGSRTLREVDARYLAPDSAHATSPPWTYGISRPDAPNTVTVHSAMTLTDASGIGAKTWTFNTGGGAAWQIGLASQYTQLASAGGAILQDDYYTWSQDPAGHPYISAKTSISNEGTGNQQSALSTQTLDQYGNVTQSAIYPYNNTTTPLQTYNNTYLVSYFLTPHYIFDLLSTSAVTAGGATTSLVSNSYLLANCPNISTCFGSVTLPSTEFDANASVAWGSEPNWNATNVKSTSYYYYLWGALSSLSGSDGSTATASADSATNYAAPQSISVQSYNQTISYNSWLGITSQTGQNGEQLTMTYDSYGRPLTATSPYGAVTNYSYNTAAPFTQTETGPNGVTTTTLDGFGRPVLVARGDTSGVHSYTATVYAPCACSPLGKRSQVSQPYQPGGSPSNWTTWTYDGLGRAVSVQQPDGASTTTYAYSGDQTTVTDPAGNWKQFTKDSLGNLTTVVEPDPCVVGNTLTTSYTYDWMSHVTGVSLARPNASYASNGVCSETGSPAMQTRTFVYNNAGLLTSATNPENGTVSYTYSSDNTLHYKQDAKGQYTVYTYDSLKLVTEIQRYPNGLNNAEDICGRVLYTWGTSPSGYDYGRLDSVQSYAPSYGSASGCGWANSYYFYGGATDQYTEYYDYAAPGVVAAKSFWLTRQFPDGSYGYAGAEADYTYDTAGRTATVTYPMTFTNNQGNPPTLTTAYDTMGQPASLTDRVDNTNWVSNVQYDYAGRMTSLSYLTGNGSGSPSATSETRTYNAATGQLATLSWSAAGISGGIQYAYSATQNNGQITQATDTVSGETIGYQYDALKRLTSASSNPINGSAPTPWTQTFQYDGFGNLTAKVLNGTTNSIPVNAPTNRLSNANYDLNGNMTSGVGATLTYDEANRMVTAQEVSGGQEYYGYDAANKRVYRVTASRQEQITFYGAFGEKLGVYGIQAGTCDYYTGCVSGVTPLSTSIWFAGRLIMDSGNGVVQDRAGTNRASGARFLPFGEELTSTTNDREKFATYTRDSYTGLDYADQRFYASTYGRFNTADPYVAGGASYGNSSNPNDPGSWNRYAYTRGDPVNRIDPSGRDDCDPTDTVCWADCDSALGCLGSGNCPAEYAFCVAGLGFTSIAGCSGIDPDQANPAVLMGCLEMAGAIGAAAQPTSAPQPQCDVELNTRPVYASGGFGTHSYLEVWGSSGMENTLEGGPTNNNPFNPGPLRSFDTINGFEYPDDLPADQGAINPISCTQANALIGDDLKFTTTATYSATGLFGPNSNSFLNWLITTGGLSSLYPTAPFGAIGWNHPVQPVTRVPIFQTPPYR